jgi:hypothetical protein
MESNRIDVIGDVHGHVDKLERLLHKMGYVQVFGRWSHRDRIAVFVGDLIDRGPHQLDTVALVRNMVDTGAARIVMGNHEFNAIAWHTKHPSVPGAYLRTRDGERGERHRRQHIRFLEEVGQDSTLHEETISWFKTIPLWIDHGSSRFVHACWDNASIARMSGILTAEHTLTEESLLEATTKGTVVYDDVELLLKGPEVKLPTGFAYIDKDGNQRHKARFAWWSSSGVTYRSATVIPAGALTPDGLRHPGMPDTAIENPPVAGYGDPVPLFVGHYWRTGTPELLSEYVSCVDYSAGKGGPLAAYRFDGEWALSPSKFVMQM